MCEHASKLGSSYPGRFCIYCGAEVGQIQAEDGQVVLERDGKRRYIAVVYRDVQKAVERIDLEQVRPRLWFRGDTKETEFDNTSLIAGFQDPEEVLRIKS